MLEVGAPIGEFGRGERNSAVMSDAFQTVRFVRDEDLGHEERTA